MTAPGTVNGSTSAATDACNLNSLSRDHYVKFILPCGGDWTVETCGGTTNFDTHIFVGTSCCDGSLGSNNDNCGTQSSTTINFPAAGQYFATIEGFGTSVAGNYTLTVTDAEDPTITCPANIVTYNDVSSCSSAVTYTAPTGTDNCTGSSTSLTAGIGTPGTFPVGTTTETYTVTDAQGNTANCSFTVQVIDRLDTSSAIIGGTTTICAGDTAWLSVMITGGDAPYVVTINNGIGAITNYTSNAPIPVTPSGTTTYSLVSVTDANGCSGSAPTLVGTATVTVSPSPSLALLAGSATICEGSSTNLDVTVSGGTGPFTVTIDNGVGTINNYTSGTGIPVSPVTTTTYNLISVSDANGCEPSTLSGSPTVTVQASPVVNLGADTAFCDGGSVVLDAGNPGSSIIWSNSMTSQTITVSTAGTYWVTVTNSSGCSKSDTIVVGSNPLPTFDLGPDTTICTGSFINLNAGNPGSTYQWSTGANTQMISVSATDSVWCTVTSADGCTYNDAVVVTVLAAPSADFSFDISGCPTIAFSDLSTGVPSNYSWNFGDGNTSTSASPSHTYTATGTYTVTMTVDNVCGTDATSKIVVVDCSIDVEAELEEKISVYPNPNFGDFNIAFEGVSAENSDVEIFNIEGKRMLQTQTGVISGNKVLKIENANLERGVYFVRITVGGDAVVRKVVVM